MSGSWPDAVALHVLEDLLGLHGVIRWKIVAAIERNLPYINPCKQDAAKLQIDDHNTE